MEIQLEKGTEEFFREFVSLRYQGRQLIKDPERKFKDMFKSSRKTLILCVFLLIWQGLMLKFSGSDTFIYVLLGCTAMLFVMVLISLFAMHNNLKVMLSKSGPSTLTLTEEYLENTSAEGEKVSVPWSKIAYCRILNESIVFMPHDISGLMIGVDAKYAPMILDWLTKNNINMRVIAGEKK